MDTELLNYGIGGVALLLMIRELFSFLKTRNNNVNGKVNQRLLDAITEQNRNHLHEIQKSIEGMCKDLNQGNDRVVKAITDMHTDLASRLGEIKGTLKK